MVRLGLITAASLALAACGSGKAGAKGATPVSIEIVAGERDAWMLFERSSSDGYPLIVRARYGNSEVEEFKQKNSAIAVRLKPDGSAIKDNGLPANTEPLYGLEDFFIAKIAELGSKSYHVATVTGDGERVLYFSHDGRLSATSVADFIPTAPAFQGSILIENVDKLGDYRRLTSPNRLDQQLDGDMQIIQNLAKHGDDGTVPRKTDFWFYGKRASLDAFLKEVSGLGFKLDHWADKSIGIVIERTMPVTVGDFRELTPKLLEVADRHDLNYDGWETFVVKPDAPEETKPVEPAQLQPKISLLRKLFGKEG